jgi:putative chitinase
MAELNAALMWAITPHNSGSRGNHQAAIIEAVGEVLKATLAEFDTDTDLRAAHFLAQICHESDGFVTTEEYASGIAYEGRLGNTTRGDGPKYKGRGLIQLTGKANYQTYGKIMGLDLVGDPELAAVPTTSLKIACQFWKQHNLNALADADNIEAITRKINGGLNGVESRRHYLTRAKAAMGLTATPLTLASAQPVLRRGDSGGAVNTLQSKLIAAGIPVGLDGDFGPATDKAVRQFQHAKALTEDGIVGSQCWAALG